MLLFVARLDDSLLLAKALAHDPDHFFGKNLPRAAPRLSRTVVSRSRFDIVSPPSGFDAP